MSEPPVEGVDIYDVGDRVVIEIGQARWEGSASDAERLLTRMHYVLGRARPGTNIASIFLNDQLWGGKLIETDRRQALREIRTYIDGLAKHVEALQKELNDADQG
jgi:hypothetical protein